MKRIILLITLLLFAALAAVFASLNLELVRIDYYLASAQLPLALLLFITLLLGVLVGVLACTVLLYSNMMERRRLRKQLVLCQQEIRNLRDIPIKDHY